MWFICVQWIYYEILSNFAFYLWKNFFFFIKCEFKLNFWCILQLSKWVKTNSFKCSSPRKVTEEEVMVWLCVHDVQDWKLLNSTYFAGAN